MVEFCVCGSLKVDGNCSNYKKNCSFGTKKPRRSTSPVGFLRNKRTGTLIDKETGMRIKT